MLGDDGARGANKLHGSEFVCGRSSEVENFLFLRLSINQKYKKAHTIVKWMESNFL